MLLEEGVWRGEKTTGELEREWYRKSNRGGKWGEGQQKVVKKHERITVGQWSNSTQVSLQVNQTPV